MAKPLTGLHVFAGDTGPEPLSLLDGVNNAIIAVINDANTYSNYLTDTGAVNAYVCAYPASITGALTAGLRVQFKVANTNTGASTLNVGATGAKSIKNQDGSALVANQLLSSGIADCEYDGTNYVLMSTSNSFPSAMFFADGSVSLPSISFVADSDTGFFRAGSNDFSSTVGGIKATEWFLNGSIAQTQVTDGSVTIPSLTFISDSDTGLFRIGANNIGITCGGVKVIDIAQNQVAISGNNNGTVGFPVSNSNSGTSANCGFDALNDLNHAAAIIITSSTFSGALLTGGPTGEATHYYNNANIPLVIGTNITQRMRFAGDGSNANLTVTAVQHNGNDLSVEYASFTGTLTGMTAGTTGTVNYSRIGKLVHMWVSSAITGTSNTTSMTMTGLPTSIQTASVHNAPCTSMTDNGNDRAGQVTINGGTITFSKYQVTGSDITSSSGAFTNSGTKGINVGWSITYSIG